MEINGFRVQELDSREMKEMEGGRIISPLALVYHFVEFLMNNKDEIASAGDVYDDNGIKYIYNSTGF